MIRHIGFIQRLIASGRLTGDATAMVRKISLHIIAAEDVMVELGIASKMSGEREFFEYLKRVGHDRGDAWLAANFTSIGACSTIELDTTPLKRAVANLTLSQHDLTPQPVLSFGSPITQYQVVR